MTLDTMTHRDLLLHILKDIYSDDVLSQCLGFKGGTAAYLFYSLSRFSVDLDFDLLTPDQECYIFEQVKKILEKYGLVKEARIKRFNLIYLLSYANKLQNAYNIKVEINRRSFGSAYEIKTYLGVSMQVMTQPDMAAHKLVAMFERLGTTNRDIFDAWFFLSKNWPINEKIIQKRTNLPMKDFLQKCIDELEKMIDRGILSGLGELLDAKQKRWVKEHLRTETMFLLRLKLNSL